MNIMIRKATIDDLDSIAELEKRCFPPKEAAPKLYLKQRIKTFPESFFVAEIDHKIVGFINGCVINGTVIYDELYADSTLHVPEGDYQTVFGLDVMPEYQHNEIATQLMNYMIKVSKLMGRKGVILTCKENLINYYKKFGYKNKGVSKSVHGGAKWYDMVLKFNLK